jgi:hypothetical protein
VLNSFFERHKTIFIDPVPPSGPYGMDAEFLGSGLYNLVNADQRIPDLAGFLELDTYVLLHNHSPDPEIG